MLSAAQLLELLEDWTTDPVVVLVAAPSLGRIVQSKPEPALTALDTHDAISKLASIIKKQQQLSPPKVLLPSCMSQLQTHTGASTASCVADLISSASVTLLTFDMGFRSKDHWKPPYICPPYIWPPSQWLSSLQCRG